MSSERLIHSRLGVEFWAGRVPAIEAVRPARCGVCGAASQCPGQPLTVVGHGVRERQQRGPSDVGAYSGPLEHPFRTDLSSYPGGLEHRRSVATSVRGQTVAGFSDWGFSD
jgi:hypothetical protein